MLSITVSATLVCGLRLRQKLIFSITASKNLGDLTQNWILLINLSQGANLEFMWQFHDWQWRWSSGGLGWWWSIQGLLILRGPLQFNSSVEGLDLAYIIPAVKFVGVPVLVPRGRKVDCDWYCLFARVFVIVFGFSVGLISPYSLELGLGLKVVPWLWRFSRGQIASTSVCFCRQYADIRSLHVVWYFLERGVEEGVVFLAVVYEVLSGLSGLFFISSLGGRFLWFEVGPFWLIWIVFNNLHVTNDIYRVVRDFSIARIVGKGYITACHSHVL